MINERLLQELIDIALKTGGDFAEIFVEHNNCTELSTKGSEVVSAISGIDFGVGIRLLKGNNSYYGFSNSSDPEVLKKLAWQLSISLKSGEGTEILKSPRQLIDESKYGRHPFGIPPADVSMKEKAALLKSAHRAAMGHDGLITQTDAKYLDQDQNILIANSNGLLARDRRVRTRVLFRAMATYQGHVESGYVGPGALEGFEFYNRINLDEAAVKAAEMAKTMAMASYCPAGKFPVIVENGFGGLMFHEACGHSLEASAVSKGNSIFAEKIGKSIGSELLTFIDDGSIKNAWGSGSIDDEGNPTQKNILIENGILRGYLTDAFSARRMGLKANGASRRQSYRFAPTSRMSNTYIDNGTSSVASIFSHTDEGLYAKTLGAGSVNPTTGDFNFSVIEGYWIKNGKIERPVRGATLVGNGAEILKSVDRVGNNLKLEQGYCFAGSGAIFVSMGQPTLRIKSITVGGRAGE